MTLVKIIPITEFEKIVRTNSVIEIQISSSSGDFIVPTGILIHDYQIIDKKIYYSIELSKYDDQQVFICEDDLCYNITSSSDEMVEDNTHFRYYLEELSVKETIKLMSL